MVQVSESVLPVLMMFCNMFTVTYDDWEFNYVFVCRLSIYKKLLAASALFRN